MARDYWPEIRRLEAQYARVDVEAQRRKNKITAKIASLRKRAGL